VGGDFDSTEVGTSYATSFEQGGADPVGEGLCVAEAELSIVVYVLCQSVVSQKVQSTISNSIHIIKSHLFENQRIIECLEALRVHLIRDLRKDPPGRFVKRCLAQLVVTGKGAPVQRLNLGVPLEFILQSVGPAREHVDNLAFAGVAAPGDVVVDWGSGGHVEVDGQVVGPFAGLLDAVTITIRLLLERGKRQIHHKG